MGTGVGYGVGYGVGTGVGAGVGARVVAGTQLGFPEIALALFEMPFITEKVSHVGPVLMKVQPLQLPAVAWFCSSHFLAQA